MPLQTKARLCMKAATGLGDEDTTRFIELFDGYQAAGVDQALAANRAASDLSAELRSESQELGSLIDALPTEKPAEPVESAPEIVQAPESKSSQEVVDYVTAKGKTIRGVWRSDLTKEEAKAIDPYAFKKDDGWFIREKYLAELEDADARAEQAANEPAAEVVPEPVANAQEPAPKPGSDALKQRRVSQVALDRTAEDANKDRNVPVASKPKTNDFWEKGGEPSFSLRAHEQANAKVAEHIAAIQSTWTNAPRTVVAFNMADTAIPEAARAAYRRMLEGGAEGSPEGFYHDGSVYLLSSKLNSPADTARVLLHETLGHHGLRGAFGNELNGALDGFARLMPQAVADMGKRYGIDTSTQSGKRQAAEEVLAHIAQRMPRLRAVQRVIAAIRTWLREHLPMLATTRLSNSEIIRNYIEPAREWVRRGQQPMTSFGLQPAFSAQALAADDFPAQVQWLNDRAHDAGFESVDEMAVKNPDEFMALAEQWRHDHPADVMFQMGGKLPSSIEVDGKQRPTTNSKGQQIAQTEAGVRAFYKWFGDSKVVDAEGRPLVVYRGTPTKGLTAFDASRIGHNGRSEGPGFYFTTDESTAAGYGQAGEVLATYLAISKPIDYGAKPLAQASVRKLLAQVAKTEAADSGSDWKDGFLSNFEDTYSLPLDTVTRRTAAIFADEESALDQIGGIIGSGVKVGTLNKALRAALGFDGYVAEGYSGEKAKGGTIWVATDPTQIKSATGNNSAFDARNPDIRFSLSNTLSSALNNAKDVALPAGYKVADLFSNSTGKLHWWHKSVGTPHNLAAQSPEFKRVYDATSSFIQDVSWYANDAADQARGLLPRVETFADILNKKPVSAADSKAVAAPVFEGTLVWTRDRSGAPVKVDDQVAAAASKDAETKAREMLQAGQIQPHVLQMWQGMELDQYEKMVNARYETTMLKGGIVWTDQELRTQFGLTDYQIGLYRQTRAAIDRSISHMAISDMLRLAGDDVVGVRAAVSEMGDVHQARKAIISAIDEKIAQDPGRADVLNDTAARINDKAQKADDLMARGYAPLMRFGDLSLDVVDQETGERLYFGLYEGRIERAAAKRRLAEAFPGAKITEGTLSGEGFKMFAGMTPETLELFGDMLGLEAQGSSESAAAFQTFLKVGKDNRSAMKRLIQRKGIQGFSEDVDRVLAAFIYSNGRMTSRNLHQREMMQAELAIPKESGELRDAASKLREYVTNPAEEATAIKGLLFTQFLGGSVASAMVNATQPFTVAMPYLSQWGGAIKAGKRMAAATRDALKKETGDADLDKALHHAEVAGIVAPQEVHQLIGTASGKSTLVAGDGTKAGDALAKATNFKNRLLLGWGRVFSVPEEFNRRTTFIAAYRTAVQEGIENPAEFAKKAVEDTMFVYGKQNRPQWARGFVGSLAFTFKTFSISYCELLYRMWKQGGPEGKRAAIVSLGVLFMMSGMSGLPGSDDLDDVIDGILQRMGYNFSSKQRRKQFFAGYIGEGGADFLERGLTALPGVPVDLSGRFGLGNLIPGTGLLTKKESYGRDVAEFGGPAAALAQMYFQSAGDVISGEPARAAANAAPVAVQNLLKAVDMFTTGMYRDSKGRKVIDTDTTDAVFKAIGFQPSAVKRVQESTSDVQQSISLARMRKQEISQVMAEGRFERDADKIDHAREMLNDWNEANPETPITIRGTDIIKRVKRMGMSKQQRIADTAPKAMRQQVREAMQEAQ